MLAAGELSGSARHDAPVEVISSSGRMACSFSSPKSLTCANSQLCAKLRAMKLFDLATQTGAECDITDGDTEITAAAGLDEAEEGHVTFLSNPKYTNKVATTRASAMYVSENGEIERNDIAVLRAKDPYLAFTRALVLFHPRPSFEVGIDPAAVIDLSAKTGEGTSIGARSVIGAHVTIGDRVRIHPNVTIYEGCSIDDDCEIHSGVAIRATTAIGKRVIIHNNAVIGSDGFGFAKDEDKRWLKIPQVGRVVIEDDVEIGANTAIDRASTGETRIKRGAKIDNLVQIGHSCIVGEDALLCAQVGIAGSSRVGDRVILTGQVGIGGHITVGDDAILYPQSGVPNDVAPGEILVGTPAFEVSAFWRAVAVFKKLGELPKRIRALEKRLDEVEKSKPED
jgi:UDP-3-O-[3-hydroxymyristoyl] glucosamine N-acyltransferase